MLAFFMAQLFDLHIPLDRDERLLTHFTIAQETEVGARLRKRQQFNL